MNINHALKCVIAHFVDRRVKRVAGIVDDNVNFPPAVNRGLDELLWGGLFCEVAAVDHGFASDPTSLPANVRATHVSLFDGTLQGIARTDKPAFSFQGHPEASPGPHDVAYLFDRFIDLMKAA